MNTVEWSEDQFRPLEIEMTGYMLLKNCAILFLFKKNIAY